MIPINFGLGQANVEVETEEDGRQQMYKKGGKLSVNRPDFGPPTYGLSSMGTRVNLHKSKKVNHKSI
jgi:hypothetical protein